MAKIHSLTILLVGLVFSFFMISCESDSLSVFEIQPNNPENEENNTEESKAVSTDSTDIQGAWKLTRYLVDGDNQVNNFKAMRLVLESGGQAYIVQENRRFEGRWRLTNNAQSLSIFMASDIEDAQIWYKEWLIMAIGKTTLDLLNITENRQLRMELNRTPEIPSL